MEQAEILIHREGKEEKIVVQYNPSEISLDQSAGYSRTKMDTMAEIIQFVGESNAKMSFKLTIDGFSKVKTDDETKAESVTSDVESIRSLLSIDPKLHKPPECTFKWGSIAFRGIAESVNVRYTMFSSEGKPIRAVVSLSLTQIENKAIAFESPDRTKRRILTQDKELFTLAAEVYGDAYTWRPIAIANGILNPRKPPSGKTLRIPPLEEYGNADV